jgi:hypothetical protein
LPAADHLGEITPEALRIPLAAYHEKALIQRECLYFAALISCAKPGTSLQPAMLAYGRLLERKFSERGIPADTDALANSSIDDTQDLLQQPFAWAQRWLREFRNDPNDNHMVAMFADRCARLFSAYKNAIQETYEKINT